MHHRHDKLFRGVFDQPRYAAPLVRLALSPDITAYLDTAHLIPAASSVIDRHLVEHRPDLVYQAALAGRSAYAIIEHQSTEHPSMLPRFMSTMAALHLQHTTRHPDAPMPVFLPILVYQGGKRGPWRAPLRLREYYSLPERVAQAVTRHLELEPAMLDLSAITEAELRAADMGPVPTLVLWALARVRYSTDLLAEFISVIDLVVEAYRSPDDREALQLILEYVVMYAQEMHPDAVERILSMSLPQEEHEPSMTIWDIIVAQGRQEGRELGRQEGRELGRQEGRELGRQEGRELGRRELVRRQLELRFGSLPPHARARLERAGLDELEVMALRLLSVATLDELLDLDRA